MAQVEELKASGPPIPFREIKDRARYKSSKLDLRWLYSIDPYSGWKDLVGMELAPLVVGRQVLADKQVRVEQTDIMACVD